MRNCIFIPKAGMGWGWATGRFMKADFLKLLHGQNFAADFLKTGVGKR